MRNEIYSRGEVSRDTADTAASFVCGEIFSEGSMSRSRHRERRLLILLNAR